MSKLHFDNFQIFDVYGPKDDRLNLLSPPHLASTAYNFITEEQPINNIFGESVWLGRQKYQQQLETVESWI